MLAFSAISYESVTYEVPTKTELEIKTFWALIFGGALLLGFGLLWNASTGYKNFD